MKLKDSTYEYMKRRAWENMDSFIHLEASGEKPWMYPNFNYKGEYIIDPWESDENQMPTVIDPESVYGTERMDSYYTQILNSSYQNPEIDLFFLNNPDTPDGWIYIGDDKKMRYALGEPGKNNMIVVGLNPSKATPQKPDMTISKVREIARREGCDGWIMVNLYPKRSTDPEKLPKRAYKEIIYTNNEIIKWISHKIYVGKIYAAWGNDIESRDYLIDQGQKIVNAIESDSWFTKGRTRAGHPRHPSRISYEEKMEWFPIQDYLWQFDKIF